MPEPKRQALARARRGGFSASNVVKGEKGYFIAPKGIKSTAAKKAYAGCRNKSNDKAKCAKIAWSVEKKK